MQFRRFVLVLALVIFTAGTAHADLDAYLHSLNISAEGDFDGFCTEVGAHFGASGSQIDLVFRLVDEPADAAVCFWLARQANRPIDVVVREYRTHKGQGWGALAKSLGIKPGSAAFKDLKRGSLGWRPTSDATGRGKGKGKGNGKGKRKS